VPALLFAFYPGGEGGHAIAEILVGDHPPTGRLPFSVPVAEADLPVFDAVSSTVEYGYLHGYRHLAAGATPAHYPFGFGRGTTSFTLGELEGLEASYAADGAVEVTVPVQNTGSRAGTETVQLYVAAIGSSVSRAPSDLRAFDQVTLAAGAAGAATLRFPVSDLAYWDDAASTWRIEAIDYEVRVQTDAETVASRATFAVR
jgi:beta-glucosidase